MNIFKTIIIFAIFWLFSLNLKGECPPGWTYGYVAGFFDPIQPWCYYWVEYCYYCDTFNKKVTREVVGIMSYSSCVVSQSRWEPFKRRVLAEVAIDAIKKCFGDLPPCDPPPPPNYTVEIRLSHCWYYENVWFNKFTNSEEWLWVMRPCENSNKCIYTYQLCIDYSLSPPDVVFLYEDCDPLGTPNCTTQEPEVPPPGKTWEEPWKTECFAQPCCPR